MPKTGEILETSKTVQENRPREQTNEKRSHSSVIPLLCVCNTRHCYRIPVVTSAILLLKKKKGFFKQKTNSNQKSKFGYSQFLAPVQLRLLKFRFAKILEVVSRPEFAQDHESGLRFDRGPVVLFDFSKLRSWKPPYGFLNSYGRFCPYSPPYKPGGKTAPPLFLGDEIYMKIYTCSHTSILEKNTSEHPLPDLRPDLES